MKLICLLLLILISSSEVSSYANKKTKPVDGKPLAPLAKKDTTSLLFAPPAPMAPQPGTRRANRSERSYVGLELGITTSMQFGGKNFAVAGNYNDGIRNAELSSYYPGVSLMASGVLDLALSNDIGLQAKGGYRQHKARATGISPAGNVSGTEPQLENDVNFTWDHFGIDALLRIQLAKNGLYLLGGLGYSSLLGNYLSGSQSFEDANGARQQMNFDGELIDFYNSTRFDAKLGIGTWLPLGESGLVIAPELMIGFPLTALHSSTTIANYEAIDRQVNNMAYATLGFAIKFPISGESYIEQPAIASINEQPSSAAPPPPVRPTMLKGRVVDYRSRPINDARVTVVDLSNNEVVASEPTEYGSFNVRVKAPGRYSVTADAHGFLFGSALYEVEQDGRILKNSGDIALSPSADGRVRLLVFFDFDKATLQSASNPELDRAVAMMKANPNMRVEIAGFTDAQGTDAYNKDLSQRRANAVREYLVRQGVEDLRLTATGYGEQSPVANNDTEDGRAENRRVEFVVAKQ